MQIKGALYLGNAGPIPVFAHWTVGLLAVLAFWWAPDLASGLAFLLALVLAIVLHELGHAVAAQVYRVPEIVIVLWGFGGFMLSQREGQPRPGRDVVITVAGPAVNYLLAILSLATLWLLGAYAPELVVGGGKLAVMLDDPALRDQALSYLRERIGRVELEELATAGLVLQSLLWVNLLLALFNSLPLIPLDGGHIAYGLLRLLRVNPGATRTICIALAVASGLGVVALEAWMNGWQPSIFTIVIMVVFVAQSVRFLKAPSP